MNKMDENIIKIHHSDDSVKDYKILLIIKREYYYVVYTDLSNTNIKEDLHVIKIKSLDSNEILPISDDEWLMIEEEYNKLCNGKQAGA